jgi:excisionase family DNA binding protein
VFPSPPPFDQLGDLLSVAEAAKYTGLSASTLWRYVNSGRLPKVQHGGARSRVLLRRLDLSAITDSADPSSSAAPSRAATCGEKLSGRRPAWKKTTTNASN